MTTFLRRLKAAWLFYRIDPYIALPADYWLRNDSEVLSHFLTGETGRKLARILSNRVSQAQLHATLKTSTPYDAGYAGGCRGTTAFIDSLLTISPPSSELTDTEASDEQGVQVDLESLRP